MHPFPRVQGLYSLLPSGVRHVITWNTPSGVVLRGVVCVSSTAARPRDSGRIARLYPPVVGWESPQHGPRAPGRSRPWLLHGACRCLGTRCSGFAVQARGRSGSSCVTTHSHAAGRLLRAGSGQGRAGRTARSRDGGGEQPPGLSDKCSTGERSAAEGWQGSTRVPPSPALTITSDKAQAGSLQQQSTGQAKPTRHGP